MFGRNKPRPEQVERLANALKAEADAYTAPVDIPAANQATAVLQRAIHNSTPAEFDAALKSAGR